MKSAVAERLCNVELTESFLVRFESVEALQRLAQLPSGAADQLRVLLHDDYLILYSVAAEVVYLLSIRHHRQLSFDFMGLWPR